MPNQYINEMLNIPELHVRQILPICEDELYIEAVTVSAIRIADRFHVHGYVIEAIQEIRKAVQRTLAPRAKALLKAHHRLLNPQEESLSPESKKKIEEMLGYSSLLRSVWEWKESFTTWYDYSPNVEVATLGFNRWIEQGQQIDHTAVKNTLKTMRNWQEEIINYHRCQFRKCNCRRSS